MMQHGYNGDYLQDPVVIVQHAGIVHNVVLQWPLQLKMVEGLALRPLWW